MSGEAASSRAWGKCEHDGKDVLLFTLKASSGAYATITNYGASLVSLFIPNRAGELGDVLLGYDALANYESHVVSMGQTVGRFANRIAKGKFSLDGQDYTLVQNNGANCLHGGVWSFDRKTWDVVGSTSSSVALKYESCDMEEGFPGKLTVTVEFSFTSCTPGSLDCMLQIRYHAVADKATVVNLTNHAYFNLCGHSGAAEMPLVLNHVAQVNAESFLAVDSGCIPLGYLAKVEGTPFDFRQPRRIGDRIDDAAAQLIYADGYDHCFVLTAGEAKETPPGTPQGLRSLGLSIKDGMVQAKNRSPDCVLREPSSGRRMEVFTEEPAVHFFTNNIPNGILGLGGKGKQGVEAYTYRTGVCFETQHFPDSPNHPSFPSTVLRPGNPYTTATAYLFSVEE